MNIHFVCTSNTFRSRMAATYLRAQAIPNLVVTSSGVDARLDPNGTISWYAQRVIENDGLTAFEPMIWTQTTKEILEKQDFVIFMEKWHYDQCVERFGFKGDNFEIWGIEDLKAGKNVPDSATIPLSEDIYRRITEKIDNFIVRKL